MVEKNVLKCPWCGQNGTLVLCEENNYWSAKHWICESCDSTYPEEDFTPDS